MFSSGLLERWNGFVPIHSKDRFLEHVTYLNNATMRLDGLDLAN
jgi:hypothetical protein